jgi:hypothetical protein
MTADQIKAHLREALDGIEFSTNTEREKVIAWATAMRNVGMWGLPGFQTLVGVQNKCVLECRKADSSWVKFDFNTD